MEKPKIKSTLHVLNEADIKALPGLYPDMTMKILVGNPELGAVIPGERFNAFLANFKAGVKSELHWHLIEVLYYVMKGRAKITDINGKVYDVRPGTLVYARPGIAGSHEWKIEEDLQLIGIRASLDPEVAFIQFAVDENLTSRIKFEMLQRWKAVEFRKSLYTK